MLEHCLLFVESLTFTFKKKGVVVAVWYATGIEQVGVMWLPFAVIFIRYFT